MRCTILALTELALLAAGCARPAAYWENRWRDLADCFAVEVGYGVGIGIEVGASDWGAAGVGCAESHKYGFVGRHPVGPTHCNNVDSQVGFPATWFGNSLPVGAENPYRPWIRLFAPLSLFYYEERHCPPIGAIDSDGGSLRRVTVSVLGVNMAALAKNRGREEGANLADAFEVDLGATLMPVSARIGFSFGQFPDFLLGWTTLDIAGDDEAGQSPPPLTPQDTQEDAAPCL